MGRKYNGIDLDAVKRVVKELEENKIKKEQVRKRMLDILKFLGCTNIKTVEWSDTYFEFDLPFYHHSIGGRKRGSLSYINNIEFTETLDYFPPITRNIWTADEFLENDCYLGNSKEMVYLVRNQQGGVYYGIFDYEFEAEEFKEKPYSYCKRVYLSDLKKYI